MKNTKLKLSIVALSIAVLSGCNENKQQSQQSAAKVKKVEQSHAVKQHTRKDFRYTWLSGVDVLNSVEEDRIQGKNYYFVIDGSGSMGDSSCEGKGRKIDIAKKAVIDYSKTLGGSKIGLVVFDGRGTSERFALSDSNHSEFRNEVNKISANSATPLASSMTIAYNKLRDQGAMQGGNGEYNLIVVTDGAASSGEDPTTLLKEIGYNSPINVTTIGFCIGSSHSLNDKDIVNYYAAQDYKSIMKGLTAVQSEGEDITEENYIKMLDSM